VIGVCVLLVSGCDAPSPSAAQPDPQPAAERAKPRSEAPALPAPKPTAANGAPRADSVVTASATADPPASRAGATLTLRIDARVESGWHIYAIDRPTGPSIPTSINFELPKTLTWDGDWTVPEPSIDESHPQEPSFIYQGSVSFSRRVRVARDAPAGPVTLRGALHYQACDRSSCRAPTQVALQTEIKIGP
jgi:DsbC/DsbD-like thiol-disulfide interchange protein